jgi:hypothetical protein
MPKRPVPDTVIIHDVAPGHSTRTVRFGSVTVTGPAPTPEEWARSVRESTEALVRLAPHLVTPGVRIKRIPGVSLYYANKDRSGTTIRELDGRKEIGTLLEDGTFRPIDASEDH